MLIKVLGSSAGGGLPQINCNCRNCALVRRGDASLRPRTQSGLAVSRHGQHWTLLNASPDLRQQIGATPELWPRPEGAQRSSPITSIVLTSAEVDHVAGLLSLREAVSFSLYASGTVLEALAVNPIFAVLETTHVTRIGLPLGCEMAIAGGLSVEAFAVPGKVALYLENSKTSDSAGDSIGLRVSDPGTGAYFYYIPGCAAVDEALASRLRGAPLVFFDGTLFSDDELIAQGLAAKTGRRMGHIAMAGAEGSLAAFTTLNVARCVFGPV